MVMQQRDRAEVGVLAAVLAEPEIRAEALERARYRIAQGPLDADALARSVLAGHALLRARVTR
jgi:hypothetical protein